MTTDLAEIVRERLAAKIKAGKRLTQTDLQYLEAIAEPAVPFSSTEKGRSTKGETTINVKTYHRDPFEAERINDEIYTRQRAKWPMSDGTVGSPMVTQKSEKEKAKP